MFRTASFNSVSFGFKTTMFTNSFRRKLSKIEVSSENFRNANDLYKKRLADIITIINEIKNDIPAVVRRKINKVIEKIEKNEADMKNENKITKI